MRPVRRELALAGWRTFYPQHPTRHIAVVGSLGVVADGADIWIAVIDGDRVGCTVGPEEEDGMIKLSKTQLRALRKLRTAQLGHQQGTRTTPLEYINTPTARMLIDAGLIAREDGRTDAAAWCQITTAGVERIEGRA